MTLAAGHQKTLLLLSIPLAFLVTIILLLSSSVFTNHASELSLTVTVDLLVCIPVVYWLVIRKSKIPNITVVPVLVIGLVVGTVLIPKTNQGFLELFKVWVLPVVELSVLGYIVFKVRKALQVFRKQKDNTADFYDAVKATCEEMMPAFVAKLFLTEISVLYYGFINWRSRPIGENEYTYHQKSTTKTILFALIFVIGIETVALHFLLLQWSAVAAWILTIVSIYTALQVFGMAKSLSQRPIVIGDKTVQLRYGILAQVEIKIDNIKSIELSKASIDLNSSIKKLSPLGSLDSHNIILHLKAEQYISGIYGIRRSAHSIALHVDEVEKFIADITARIQRVE